MPNVVLGNGIGEAGASDSWKGGHRNASRGKGLVQVALLGATLNILAYGYSYGQENHPFELAMLNWLRDPSLYPGDAIRNGFSRFPTVFWKLVALFPQRIDNEATLFFFFVLTKFVFFLGLARIAFWCTSDRRFARIAAVLVSLSPVLNARSPFGADHVLAPNQNHTPLAIALLVCAGAGLLEGRWIIAVVLASAGLWFSAPYAIYMLFAFAAFAVLDWRTRSRSVVIAGALGAALSAPWVIVNREHMTGPFPSDYVEALRFFYPANLTLSAHRPVVVLMGFAFLAAVLAVAVWAHLEGAAPGRRLELMALAFVPPVLIGGLAGEFFLRPRIANFELLRADAFLLFYSALVIILSVYRLADRGLIPLPAVVLPVAILVFAAPHDWLRLLLLLLGLQVALWNDLRNWFDAGLKLLGDRCLSTWVARGVRGGVGAAVVLVYGALFTLAAHSWKPRERFAIPSRNQDAWSSLQTWARLNTPKDAVFLVPTDVEGFRVLSDRSSWGEWKDGTAVYLYPPFADEYIRRMNEVGWQSPPDLRTLGVLKRRYESERWESLLAVARRNHLQFIVQYREIHYPVAPVYANSDFAVYSVPDKPGNSRYLGGGAWPASLGEIPAALKAHRTP